MKEQFTAVQNDVTAVQNDVAAVQNDVTAVQNDVTAVQDDVAAVKGDVATVQDDVVTVAGNVERNSADITSLGVRGSWCGEQDDWGSVGTITYDSIFYYDSNMNITDTPLNINTGINRSIIFIWILVFVTFQGSSLCQCLEPGI